MLRDDEVTGQTDASSSPTREFATFVREVEPRLRRALVALRGSEDGRDATAEALAYAWEHWDRVVLLDNPVGYLYRVAQSRSRRRRTRVVFTIDTSADVEVEPGLPRALARLSPKQRLAVVLVHGFDWSVDDVATLTGTAPTSIRSHLERGLRRLRRELGAETHE